jgi:hypothetical protein
MKRQVIVERTFCDICGKEASGYQKCIICGKEFCYDCTKIAAIEYEHGVHFSGSGDGLYCHECDKKALENGDKLHLAYLKIAALRNEAAGYWADFEKRTKKAEEELKRIQA